MDTYKKYYRMKIMSIHWMDFHQYPSLTPMKIKSFTSKWLAIPCTVACAWTSLSISYGATILTFDKGAMSSTGKLSLSSVNYGDRANAAGAPGVADPRCPAYTVTTDTDGTVGTPNIALAWQDTGGTSSNGWQFHYGSSGNSWRDSEGVGQFMDSSDRYVTFSPDKGYSVTFDSLTFLTDTVSRTYNITVMIFDAEEFAENDNKKEGLTALWSLSTGDWTSPGAQPSDGNFDAFKKDFDFSSFTGEYGQALTLVFVKTKREGGGSPYNDIAIDDFTFSQNVIGRLDVAAATTETITSLGQYPFDQYFGVDNNGNLVVSITEAPGGDYPNGLVINDLRGSSSAALIDTSGSSTNAVITFVEGDKAIDLNGAYLGSISGNAQLVKAGSQQYNLTIGGSVGASKLTVQAGSLRIDGNATITGDTIVETGTSLVLSGAANTIGGALQVASNAQLQANNLTVGGNASFKNATLTGTSLIGGTAAMEDGGTLDVGSLTVTGRFTGGNNATIMADNLTLTGGLTVGQGADISADNLTIGADSQTGANSTVTATSLTLDGNLVLGNGSTANISSLGGSKALTLTNSTMNWFGTGGSPVVNAQILGTGNLNLATGRLSLGSTGSIGPDIMLYIDTPAAFEVNKDLTLLGVEGRGTLDMNGGTIRMTGGGNTFTGSFTRQGSATGTLDYAGSGVQAYSGPGAAFVNLTQSGTGGTVLTGADQLTYGDVIVNQGTLETTGNLTTSRLELNQGTLNLAKNLRANAVVLGANTRTQLGAPALGAVATMSTNTLDLGAGGSMSLQLSSDFAKSGGAFITVSGAVAEPVGGKFTFEINALGTLSNWSETVYEINIIDANPLTADLYTFQLDTLLRNAGLSISRVDVSNGLKLVISSSDENAFLPNADSPNTAGAAEMLWSARQYSSPNSQLDQVLAAMMSNSSSAQIRDSLASLAGSSVTSTLGATRDDLYQQVGSIRNRVAQMGLAQDVIYHDLPYYNAWIQANGGYHDLNQQGDRSGYTLDTWGGTVGADLNLSQEWTVGLAFTVNHNKVKSKAYDRLTSDNIACYGNVFARLQIKNWTHSLILTGGWNDIDIDRTVFVSGTSPISSSASTDGRSYGGFYEGAYRIKMNRKGDTILQPFANAGLYRTTIDSYTETGSGDMAMRVDDVSATHGRAGIGARLMGVIGTNTLGRESYGELRVQGVQDYGDQTNKAGIAFATIPGQPMTVSGAKVGRTGFQVGAGLSVPVSYSGAIYCDVDADFRQRATSVSGSLGYRHNF